MPWIKKVKPPRPQIEHICKTPKKKNSFDQFLWNTLNIKPRQRFTHGSIWRCSKCKKLWEYQYHVVNTQWIYRPDLRVGKQGLIYVVLSD